MIATFINDIPTEIAQRAYAGISFAPDKRAVQEREGYAASMASDYRALAELIANKPEMQTTLDTEFARYREGYRARVIKKLQSDSRCLSWMITGPANFPTRRNEKRNNVAHKRLTEMLEFRERALAAIRKALCPELRPIMAGDSDAVSRLETKIAQAEKEQAQMKAANAIIRKAPKNQWTAEKELELNAIGITGANAKALFEPDFCGRIGFADYELTNNNANIRRMKQRHEGLERNKAEVATEVEGSNARLEDCPADNRVRLFFPGKPDESVRSRLKSSGFRWTPTLGCWQAYRNPGTIATAQREAGL